MQKTPFYLLLSLCLSVVACSEKKQEEATQEPKTTQVDSTASRNVQPEMSTPTQSEVASTAIDETYLIGEHSMGKVKIGMTKADITKLYPKAKSSMFQSEGAEMPCWIIADADGKELFQAILDEETKKVQSFFTENPKMVNAKKVHVGSKYSELKGAYPDIKVGFAEGYIASSDKSPNISFGLKGDIKLEVNDSGVAKSPAKVSPSTTISDIFVY